MAQNLKLEVVLGMLDRATKPIRAITKGSVGLGRELKATRDQLKQLERQQSDISGWRTLNNATKQTTQAISANRDRVRELSRQMAQTSNPTKALTNDFRRAVREAHALKQKHQEQQRELQGLRGRLNNAGISTRNLGEHERTLRQRINSTNNQLQEQERRLRAVTAQQKRLAAAKRQYQRTQQMTGAMAGTGAAGLATGSAMLYAGARIITPGIDFGAQMSELQAITRLERESQDFQMLRDQARQLGGSTAFSATEVGAGQTFLARAGFTPEAIRTSMKDVLSLALANNADLARTADIASNISSAFKIDPSVEGNITRVADVLSGTAARANVDLEMLGDTMKYLGGKSDLGLTLEQAATMAGLLGNIGIQGSQGGTTTRALVNRLTAPAKAGREAMEELELQVANAQGGMRDIPDILRDINNATRDMGNVKRQALLTAIFGTEAGSGSAELVSQMAGGALDDFLNELMNLQGENQRMADILADNLGGDLKGFRSAWEDVGITIQDQNDGPLREWVQSWTALLRGVTNWIKENPELTATIFKTAAGFAMLITVFGVLTVTLASILGPFAMIRLGVAMFGIRALALLPILKAVGTAFMWLGRLLLLNPIGLAITLLIAAGWLLYKNWDGVIGGAKALWQDLGGSIPAVLATVGKFILNWSPLGLFYKAFAAVMSWFGVDLPSKFTDFGSMLMQGLVTGIKNSLGAVKGAITGAGNATVSWFKEKLGIRSPSRVFAELGGFTMQGLAQGIQRQQGEPLAAVAGVSQRMANATSGISFDSRRPLAARNAAASNPAGGRYEINIHAAPGMDPHAIARAVAAELDRRERESAAGARGALYDQE
ncbi:MAG TPA: phage tail tape measure protein [Pseudomonas sabulinigri]|uniref:Phage tail tape measure protein domain-containing protein n=1 Tax=marine sediment metagenome TaxID=412755 RepID=A0A0F9YHV6_9ZZZZ|nr:phage tail tape measure protein [Halopseudomonas sabulinigri]HEC50828.1 phage tail tape measure protein [Halopseudomonas sabulinigri]